MFEFKNNCVRISVRNLVEFIDNSGSIDSRRGGTSDAKAMLEGARLHRKIQQRQGDGYRAEVSLKETIDVVRDNSYRIVIEGRADGVLQRDETDYAIDEIKCVYADIEKMSEPVPVHLSQAKCYAYILAKDLELEKIDVMMTYCQMESEAIRVFEFSYSFAELKDWFEKLLEKFYKWTDFCLAEYEKRQESIKNLQFPYDFRKGQKGLIASVYNAIVDKENLFIQAPTGTGKTIATLFPAIKSLGNDFAQKIFYLTAKTITRTVAVETFRLLKSNGLYFRNIVITAKDKVCPLEERKCNPDDCPYANEHYSRVNDAVYDMVSNELDIDAQVVMKYAMKHNVCPFEMSLDATYWCDGIICDYNYVFDPNVYLRRFFGEGVGGEYIFLADEAHNLVERGRNMYSATIEKEELLALKNVIKDVDKRLAGYISSVNKHLLEMKKECDNLKVFDSQAAFLMALERVFYRIQTFFEEHKRFPQMEEVSNVYLKIRHYLNMAEVMDEKYIIYTDYGEDNHFRIHEFCADPSNNLSLVMEKAVATVLFSATLLPVNYYKEMLSGDVDDKAIYAHSVFDENKRHLLVANDVTSRYTRRNVTEFDKMADYIVALTKAKAGNYLVFFPSFSYMGNVIESLKINYGGYMGECELVYQKPSMSESERETFLNAFENGNEGTKIGFCVIGGVFSEGIDLKEDSLIGTAIVGTGLPQICEEREVLRQFFNESGKDGYAYAYTYPGMNKVLQAAGRVIRTEQDLGVILLLDDRFLTREYLRLFPREWSGYEVCNRGNVNQRVREFWSDNE